MKRYRPILIVEDDPYDMELILSCFRKFKIPNACVCLRDGEEALNYLFRKGRHARRPAGNPALIVLDLKMPKVGGAEVLEQLRSDKHLTDIPVVVLTALREEDVAFDHRRYGVKSFLQKSVNYEEFQQSIRLLSLYIAILNEPYTHKSRPHQAKRRVRKEEPTLIS